MLTAEDCRGKAAECLGAAEAATDPKTSASFSRTAELWTALALQIEEEPHAVRQRNAEQVADILRERLQLSDFDEPKS